MPDKPPPKKDKKPASKPPSGPPTPGMGGAGGGGGAPPFGARPPMPGAGVDPYAALMGAISPNPMGPPGAGGMPPGMDMGVPPGMDMGMPPPGMDMPMGGGPGGMNMPPSGPTPGLGLPGMGMPGMDQGMHGDAVTQALMGGLNPPDMAEHVFDPQQVDDQQMSLQQLLQLLALAQGGIPNSGLTPPAPPRNISSGLQPNVNYLGQ